MPAPPVTHPCVHVVAVNELAPIIGPPLLRAQTQPLSVGIAARFPLDSVVHAFRTMEAGAPGKVLVVPDLASEAEQVVTRPSNIGGRRFR